MKIKLIIVIIYAGVGISCIALGGALPCDSVNALSTIYV